jgi:hypothetical protein
VHKDGNSAPLSRTRRLAQHQPLSTVISTAIGTAPAAVLTPTTTEPTTHSVDRRDHQFEPHSLRGQRLPEPPAG